MPPIALQMAERIPRMHSTQIRDVAAAPSQDEADELLREVALAIKGGCEQEPAAAARN